MKQDNHTLPGPLHHVVGQTLVRVADIMPFWRYAVGPASNSVPAIPFYSKKSAEEMFAEVISELPFCGHVMYRRRFWSRTVDEVKRFTPCQKCGGIGVINVFKLQATSMGEHGDMENHPAPCPHCLPNTERSGPTADAAGTTGVAGSADAKLLGADFQPERKP